MPSKDTFGFGNKPCMKEVPPGADAIFTFRGDPELIETEYGEKYSFPITLISHPSYPNLDSIRPLETTWQSKCQSAKQVYEGLNGSGLGTGVVGKDFERKLKKHYEESVWVLTRFDTGAYWLEIQ